jgi:hypothetical protein
MRVVSLPVKCNPRENCHETPLSTYRWSGRPPDAVCPYRVWRRRPLRLLGRSSSPGNHASAGKRKTGKTRKGNHAIHYLLCEAANAARRTHSTLPNKYPSLVPRKGPKKAIIAVPHKMIRTIFVLFTRREASRDPGIDYQAIGVSKNAPRWIQALKKYGYWPKSASVQTSVPTPAH